MICVVCGRVYTNIHSDIKRIGILNDMSVCSRYCLIKLRAIKEKCSRCPASILMIRGLSSTYRECENLASNLRIKRNIEKLIECQVKRGFSIAST